MISYSNHHIQSCLLSSLNCLPSDCLNHKLFHTFSQLIKQGHSFDACIFVLIVGFSFVDPYKKFQELDFEGFKDGIEFVVHCLSDFSVLLCAWETCEGFCLNH